jgi:penicillin-binding protein 2
MVYNNAQYDLMVNYNQLNPKMDTAKFCRLLGIDDSTFRANIEKDWSSVHYSKSIPYVFLPQISPETFAKFQESLYEFPGFYAQLRNVRGYPQSNGGQLLGYLNEVNAKQLKDSVGIYEPGDYIGITGLERYYEGLLRGKKGVEFILKDNLGRLVGPWKDGKVDTVAEGGHDMISTIDYKLQALGEYMMTGKIGAIIAIEPKTGEILSMVTSPTYDPNMLTIGKHRNKLMAALTKDSMYPLFNRAVQAKYPPGSIYKPMIAAIALQMGVWGKNNGVGCARGYHYNNLTIKCHSHSYAGNLAEGIEHSCNAYFCTLYRAIIDRFGFRNARTGLDSLNAYIERFGMGKRLGIDFPGEDSAYIPRTKLYDKMYKTDGVWYSTTILSNGIGQGENQLTTLQMANLAAILANRGWFVTPHLIKGFRDTTDARGYKPFISRFNNKRSTGVASEHFEYIVEGMRRVIASGTGSNARISGIDVCGKTGTSQNPHGDDSSVFIGFAPKDDPQIAVAVYVENGGWGNSFAAPMTGLMIEQYLRGDLPADRLAVKEKMHRARYAFYPGRGYYVSKSGN